MILQKKQLWATPIYKAKLNITQQENNDLYDLFSGGEYSVHSINAGKSTFPHRINNDTVRKLYQMIDEQLACCVRDNYPPAYHYYISMSWAYSQRPGEYMNLHSHPKSNFVATYYVRVPQDSGSLVLVDPRGGIDWFSNSNGNDYTTVYEEIYPEEGDLIIFPGYLLHEVRRNASNSTRMCIAHNITCDLPSK